MDSLIIELEAPNGRRYSQPTGLFIDNKWTPGHRGNKIQSIDPTTEREIVTVHAAEPEDVDRAVQAARTAFDTWRDVASGSRADLLFKLAHAVEEQKELLATVETWDNGKPYEVSLQEDLVDVVNVLKYYAGWADKIHGNAFQLSPTKMAYTIREPVGVCGLIIPWNYPLSMAVWKLAPALACGNTVVLKPAEQTPLSILVLAGIMRQVGFPPGVVNIVNGYGKIAGSAIAAHKDVDKIAFTGSTLVGKEIVRLAAGTLKQITIETGGKSPILVLEDADLQEAVEWAHLGIMSNQGQICTATSRILVHDSIYFDFVERFKDYTRRRSIIGDPFRYGTYQGPQVSKAQADRIISYVEQGKQDGATLLMGGAAYQIDAGRGFFVTPTVFTDVTSSMRIFQEEVFGPFCTISSFTSEIEAINIANDSLYGLGAAIFTKHIARAHRLARRLEAGTIWINSSQDSDHRVPFGGNKQSGIGRELGQAGIEAYTIEKAVHVNLASKL